MFICYSVLLMYLKQTTDSNLSPTPFANSSIIRENAIKSQIFLFPNDEIMSTTNTTTITTTSTTTTTTTTNIPTHKRKPEAANGDELQQDHVTKPSKDEPASSSAISSTSRLPNELILNCLHKLNRTCPMSISQCVLLDTSFLTTTTTTPISFSNSTSLKTTTPLAYNTTVTSLLLNELNQVNCSYTYFYTYSPVDGSINSRIQLVDLNNTNCSSLVTDFDLGQNINATCLNMSQFYFDYSRTSTTERNCTFKSDTHQKRKYTCSFSMSCDYDTVSSWSDCYTQFGTTAKSTAVNTTTTALSATTTTSKTSTTTFSTTSTTTTTTTTTTTNITTTIKSPNGYLIDLVDLTSKNIIDFYSKVNNLQLLYIVMAILNIALALLYALLLLQYLKAILAFLLDCFCRVCHPARRAIANNSRKDFKFRTSTSSISFKKLKLHDEEAEDEESESEGESSRHNRIKLSRDKISETILTSPKSAVPGLVNMNRYRSTESYSEEEDEDKSKLYHPRRASVSSNGSGQQKMTLRAHNSFNRSKVYKQLFILFVLFGKFGGLFANFLLFMNNYLVSRLSREYFYQAEMIDRLFYFSLCAGHSVVLGFLALLRQKRTNGVKAITKTSSIRTPERHKILRILICLSKSKRYWFLLCNLVFLFGMSVLQLSSEHFSANDLKLLLRGLSYGNSNGTAEIHDSNGSKIKLNHDTIVIYGLIYPLIMSSLLPLLANLIDDNRNIFKIIRSRHNFILIIWFFIFAGAMAQSLINNYFIYTLFKSQNFFIYTNIVISFVFMFLIIVYFYLN